MYSYHIFIGRIIDCFLYSKNVTVFQHVIVCVSAKGPRLQLCAKRHVRPPTNHAVNGAKEHGALGGGGTLAQVLQHQRAVAEDVDKLAQVEDSHLLQVLPLLVGGGRAEEGEKKRGEIYDHRQSLKIGMTVGGGTVCVCLGRGAVGVGGETKAKRSSEPTRRPKTKRKRMSKRRRSRKRFRAAWINEVKEKHVTQRRAGVSGKVRLGCRGNGNERWGRGVAQ